MFKRFMRSKPVQVFIGLLIAGWMVLIKYTTRWEVERPEALEGYLGTDRSFIVVSWHSRLMLLISAWKRRWQTPYVLISLSQDGAVVDYAARMLGLVTIRGSAKKAGSDKAKGGRRAGRSIHKALEEGGVIAMLPDGPRGPRQRLSLGSLRLAKMSGRPLVPLTLSVKNRVQLNSWDKFVLPLPFGRGRIIWGEPVFIPAEADDAALNTIKTALETQMNRSFTDADTALGHTPVLPAEPK